MEEDALLQSERLLLLPLTADQLRLLCYEPQALEWALGIRYEGEPLEELLDILAGQLPRMEQDPENWLWDTFWLIVRREDAVCVGTIDFKAPPDAAGAVEIGYGLGEGHRGSGYMTEAARTLCGWALARPEVTAVTAETLPENRPSQNVLRRCGFVPAQQAGWWRLERPGGEAGA